MNFVKALQGPKVQDLVLICLTLESKLKKQSEFKLNQDIEVDVLQIDNCKPVLRMNTFENVLEHFQQQPMKEAEIRFHFTVRNVNKFINNFFSD